MLRTPPATQASSTPASLISPLTPRLRRRGAGPHRVGGRVDHLHQSTLSAQFSRLKPLIYLALAAFATPGPGDLQSTPESGTLLDTVLSIEHELSQGGESLSVPLEVWGFEVDSCESCWGSSTDTDIAFLSVHLSDDQLDIGFLWSDPSPPSLLRLRCSHTTARTTETTVRCRLAVEAAAKRLPIAHPVTSTPYDMARHEPTGSLVVVPSPQSLFFTRGDSCSDTEPDMFAAFIVLWSAPPREYFREGDFNSDGDVDLQDALAFLYAELYSYPWADPR